MYKKQSWPAISVSLTANMHISCRYDACTQTHLGVNSAYFWDRGGKFLPPDERYKCNELGKLCITLVGRAQRHLGCSVRRHGAVHSGAYGLPHSTKRCAQMACAPRGCGPIGLSLCCAPWLNATATTCGARLARRPIGLATRLRQSDAELPKLPITPVTT